MDSQARSVGCARHQLSGWLICVLAALSSVSLAAEQSSRSTPPPSLTLNGTAPYRYDFRLEKGAGTPVCDAYLKRLRNTDFSRLPQCDRPENTSVAGFKALDRVPLTEEEVLSLYEPVAGWLIMDDLEYYDHLRANAAKIGRPFVSSAAQSAAQRHAALTAHGSPLYFRVTPTDLDNDGVPDRVVVWKKEGLLCGSQSLSAIFPVPIETYLVALDERGQLDVGRTRTLLEWREQPPVDNRATGPVDKIAETFGVFSFEGEYYTDAFYRASDNLEEQYKAGKAVSALLGVFHRKNRVGTVACQIRWYDRPQK